jgi:hypothetical protein
VLNPSKNHQSSTPMPIHFIISSSQKGSRLATGHQPRHTFFHRPARLRHGRRVGPEMMTSQLWIRVAE